MRGDLIILEGPDGAGKTTTAAAVLEHLRRQGIHSELFELPGKAPGTLGKLVHDLHHDPARHGVRDIHATSVQLLHAAAHIDAIQTRIRPALAQGATVIMDRFWWSTIVYGRDAGVDEESLRLLEQLARRHWSFASPTAAFVFLTPPHKTAASPEAFERLRGRYAEFLGGLHEEFPIVTAPSDGRTPLQLAEWIVNELRRNRRSTDA